MKTNLRNFFLLTALLIPLGLLFTGCPKAETALRGCDDSEINITHFNNTLNYAKNLHNTTYEGTSPGRYPSGSKAILQTAIDDAEAILDMECVEQYEVEAAANTLQQAIDDYEAKKIPSDGGGEG